MLTSALAASVQTLDIVGTWVLAGSHKLLPDGTRVSEFGSDPHGLVIFTADGYYSVQIYCADRFKFSSGDKLKGTSQEYQDASHGMSAHFGLYTLNSVKNTITIDRASFPNWDDTTQVHTFEMKGDQLCWKVAPRPDGPVLITVLRRSSGAEQLKVKGLH